MIFLTKGVLQVKIQAHDNHMQAIIICDRILENQS